MYTEQNHVDLSTFKSVFLKFNKRGYYKCRDLQLKLYKVLWFQRRSDNYHLKGGSYSTNISSSH